MPTHRSAIDPGTLTRLHESSGAARWNVSPQTLADALDAGLAHRFAEPPTAQQLESYLATLHLQDLALACACRDAHEAAWDHFVREIRPALYASARAIAADDGRELADSMYAELFGLPGADGVRRSLLAYYHGRSKLITWLRAVLVQRHIDRRRREARLTPLDDDEPATADSQTREATPDPDRDALVAKAQRAVDDAIDALEPRDRLRLRLYYGKSLTLARIGKLLGESEATVSRKLDRVRRDIRTGIERRLREEHGLADAAVRQCFEYAAEAPELRLDRVMSGADTDEAQG